MKLMTLNTPTGLHCAVMVGDHVLDLVLAAEVIADAKSVPPTIRGVLSAGTRGLDAVKQVAGRAGQPAHRRSLLDIGALVPVGAARLAPVVPDPELILSGSMNSREHLKEMNDGLPEEPCAFLKVRSALAASGDDIVAPPGHENMIDWEGEFCLVIGERCHRVSEAEALDYVAGYTLLNDVSAREYVRPFVTAKGAAATAQAWERNVLGKNFPTFCPLGPVIATKDEFPEDFDYLMETRVNGKVMQSSTQADLVFGPAQMVAYFSQFYIFQPGDVISMGSPPGVGMARKPPVFLKDGDVVDVWVAEIGALSNRFVNPWVR